MSSYLICYPGMPHEGSWLHATEGDAFAEATYLSLIRGVTVTVYEVGASESPRYVGITEPHRYGRSIAVVLGDLPAHRITIEEERQ